MQARWTLLLLPPDPFAFLSSFHPSFYHPLTLLPPLHFSQCGYSQWTSAYRNIAWRDCVSVCACKEERFWPMNPCCALSSSTVSILSKWSLGMQNTHPASLPISPSVSPSPYHCTCLSEALFPSVYLLGILFLSLFLLSLYIILPVVFFSPAPDRGKTSKVAGRCCIKHRHSHC